jgi:glycosyl transferase family 25
MNNITDIKNIFYINLENRVDRKIHFEKQMLLLGLNATRFNAIKHEYGAIGCSMSHLALLKHAKEQNLDHILSMEDDIMFLNPRLFINSLNHFLRVNKDFDVLMIAGNNMGDYNILSRFFIKITKCHTTTGYLVKKHYYDKIIFNYEEGINKLMNNINFVNKYAVDQYWQKLQLQDKWYLLTPLTVTQKPDYSDIDKRYIDYNHLMLNLNRSKLTKKTLPNPMNSIIYK